MSQSGYYLPLLLIFGKSSVFFQVLGFSSYVYETEEKSSSKSRSFAAKLISLEISNIAGRLRILLCGPAELPFLVV